MLAALLNRAKSMAAHYFEPRSTSTPAIQLIRFAWVCFPSHAASPRQLIPNAHAAMASSVLLEKVVPALGAIISTLMYAAPIKAVLKAVSVKNLGVSRAVT